MTKPMVRIHNVETDEIVDREMTEAEYQVHLENQSAYQAAKVLAETQTNAKAAAEAKLAALGLTADDLKALGL